MKRKHCGGFIGIPMVTIMAIIFTLSVTMIFSAGLMRRDQVAKTQLRLDYHQREETILRAILAIVPHKAMEIMKADYAASSDHSWDAIFSEAIEFASASESITEETRLDFGLSQTRSADVGDHSSDQIKNWITSLTGIVGEVTPGTKAHELEFEGLMVPPLLDFGAATSLENLDVTQPVVSVDKLYVDQSEGLLADVDSYPRYNILPFPSIRFSYVAPGQPFVAKRNWWAFTIHYGAGESGGDSSLAGVRKNYVLSLYEVPSQLPIEAPTDTEIGLHHNAEPWNASNIQITEGGIYADRLLMNGPGGAYGADRLSGRRAIDIPDALTLENMEVGGDFDALGERERLQRESRSGALPIALSTNSGRFVFFPLPTDYTFLAPAGNANLTKWDTYLGGAKTCKIHVEALSMNLPEDQTPTKIRVSYKPAEGADGSIEFTRGLNWPTQAEDPAFPFQTELTNSLRSCLTFYPSLLDPWLVGSSIGGASVDANNSILFTVVAPSEGINVRPVSNPPDPTDMCVIIRKGKDLTDYTNGLSIVTPHRVYIGDDLNEVPAVSTPYGWDPSEPYYPPMSIFASEIRVGTIAFNRPIDHHGQLGTLLADEAKWNPLDVKSGTDDSILSADMQADLHSLRSPAELPPVHRMNWMVTIEEIP